MSDLISKIVKGMEEFLEPNNHYGVFRKRLFKRDELCYANKSKEKCEKEKVYLTKLNRKRLYKFYVKKFTYMINPDDYIILEDNKL